MTFAGYPIRGQVFEADLSGIGPKLWLVVSPNVRNRNLEDVLTVRLTTTPKKPRPSIIELDPRADAPFVGRVICDDIGPLYKDELGQPRGALSLATMARVDRGLIAALGIDLARLRSGRQA
ncbi:MAG: type II toxin-antitoxin system PemK/MazF family toxin [Jiangellaceae bacterium]